LGKSQVNGTHKIVFVPPSAVGKVLATAAVWQDLVQRDTLTATGFPKKPNSYSKENPDKPCGSRSVVSRSGD
jgi:hypothetical protein